MNNLCKRTGGFMNRSYRASIQQETTSGDICGFELEPTQVLAWYGVPYAAPPVGQLRWRAPVPADKWQGVLETKKFASKAFQYKDGKYTGSEDCLYLNIWRPNSDEANLPVLIFLHGGGNKTGNGGNYEKDAFARNANCVLVTINYRLNAMGWFAHPSLQTGDPLDGSGNYGLLDIRQALIWVQENIRGFGGDADNVTLGGSSAGARNVLALTISSLSEGLFHKTIVLCGGMTTCSRDKGYEASNHVLTQLLIKDRIVTDEQIAKAWIRSMEPAIIADYLRQQPPEAIWEWFPDGEISMDSLPHLFTDGVVIPAEGFGVMGSGDYMKLPMVIGSSEDEFSIYSYKLPMFKQALDDRSIYQDAELKQLWEDANLYGSRLYTYFNLEDTALRMAGHKDQPPIYAYRFGWGKLPGVVDEHYRYSYGCKHSMDVPFVFGYWDDAKMKIPFTLSNLAGREALSRMLGAYFKSFLHNGNPNGAGLPDWNCWCTGEVDGMGDGEARGRGNVEDKARNGSSARVMKFNATSDEAIAAMSEELLVEKDIIEAFEQNVPLLGREIIIRDIFKNRFFIGPALSIPVRGQNESTI
jgi:para-nitrobenzyl esterase